MSSETAKKACDAFDGGVKCHGRLTGESGTRVNAPHVTAGPSAGRAASSIRPVDRVEELGQSENGLAPTDWSQCGIVRINSVDKTKIRIPVLSRNDIVGMGPGHSCDSSSPRIRLLPSSELESRLKLVPFHQSETPILCDLPRVKFTNLGPFHEITIVGHSQSRVPNSRFRCFPQEGGEVLSGDAGMLGKLKKASEIE